MPQNIQNEFRVMSLTLCSSPLTAMSSVALYLRSSPILFSQSPSYDDKGRQLPFNESPLQRRERHAFVKSLQWRRNVATWMHEQRHSVSASQSSVRLFFRRPNCSSDLDDFIPNQPPDIPSPSSSESSSPRTPASPVNTPHTHTPQQDKQQQAALDAELAKLALVNSAAQSAPPLQRQPHNRNYKNLHLANTAYTPRYQAQTRVPQQPRAQAPTRGIFDSSSYTYPSAFSYPHPEEDDQADGGEPYIFYSSSSTPKRPSTAAPVAGIGEFPCPAPRTSPSIQTSSLQSPSSSSPRALTLATTTAPPLKPRQIGNH